MVWVGVSLKHRFYIHVFPSHHPDGPKFTVNGDTFLDVMQKRGGFFQYLRRHRAYVAMDNAPVHNKARAKAQEKGYGCNVQRKGMVAMASEVPGPKSD